MLRELTGNGPRSNELASLRSARMLWELARNGPRSNEAASLRSARMFRELTGYGPRSNGRTYFLNYYDCNREHCMARTKVL